MRHAKPHIFLRLPQQKADLRPLLRKFSGKGAFWGIPKESSLRAPCQIPAYRRPLIFLLYPAPSFLATPDFTPSSSFCQPACRSPSLGVRKDARFSVASHFLFPFSCIAKAPFPTAAGSPFPALFPVTALAKARLPISPLACRLKLWYPVARESSAKRRLYLGICF